MTLASLDVWLRELLVAGPSSRSPLERRVDAADALHNESLPPRASRALDELATTGSAAALLDLCAWLHSNSAARIQLASTPAELLPVSARVNVAASNVALDDRPFERWIQVVSQSGADAQRAVSLLATADSSWLDEQLGLLERSHGALPDQARWLLAPLRSMAPRVPLTERLFRWLDRAPPVWRGPLLVALSRSDEVDTDRFEVEASKGIDDPDLRSVALGTTLDRAPERGVRVAFAWLAAGVFIERSTHLRALDTAAMRFVPEARALAAHRLEDGPFAWEVDRLERIARH